MIKESFKKYLFNRDINDLKEIVLSENQLLLLLNYNVIEKQEEKDLVKRYVLKYYYKLIPSCIKSNIIKLEEVYEDYKELPEMAVYFLPLITEQSERLILLDIICKDIKTYIKTIVLHLSDFELNYILKKKLSDDVIFFICDTRRKIDDFLFDYIKDNINILSHLLVNNYKLFNEKQKKYIYVTHYNRFFKDQKSFISNVVKFNFDINKKDQQRLIDNYLKNKTPKNKMLIDSLYISKNCLPEIKEKINSILLLDKLKN